MFEGREYPYSVIDLYSSRFASLLQWRGISKGSRVAVKLRNCPEFVVTWFGAAKAGCILVPINPAYKGSETNQILAHAKPKLLVTRPELVESVPAVQDVLMLEGTPGFSLDHPLEGFGQSFVPPTIVPEDPLVIIYTSGTTGGPKGVVQSHRTYIITGRAFPQWLGLTSSDVLSTTLPLNHINAQAYSVMGAVGAGATLVLREGFSLSRFWDELKESGATEFNAIGAMLMLMYKNLKGTTDHRVRVCYGAPALQEDVRLALEERFRIRIIFGYGLSECTFGCIEPLEGPRRPLTLGKPRSLAGYPNEVAVMDGEGKTVPDGTVGEIVLKNAAVMNGYFGDDEKTRHVLRSEWLHTGDLGYRDRDGFLYFVDRSSETIRRRGENISSSELESVIDSHPHVAQSAVVGIPSELSDDDVVAFVVPMEGSTLSKESVLAWCEERLAGFKLPTAVFIVGSLPQTPTFRVAKAKLRAEAVRLLGR